MSTSGDRHLRTEPSGKLQGLVDGPRTVIVRASGAYAATYAGQVLLQLLVNLLSRQFGVIDTMWLDVPPTPVDRRAFPFPIDPCGNLLEQLLCVAQATGAGEVRVEPATGTGLADTAVLVGPALEPRSASPFAVVAYGDGWDAFCSPNEASPHSGACSEVPFGPLLAACLAASMVFLRFHQVTTTQTARCNLWHFNAAGWQGPDEVASLGGVHLPPVHLIGLGAVGAAFAFSLALAPGLSGTMVGIDPQVTGDTNRNRLLSILYHDLATPKVALAARFFERTQIRFYANRLRWPDYAIDPERVVPPDVRAEEDLFHYTWVISCVDRNIDRQNIARFRPTHVLGGSTEGLVAQATYYALDGPCECLACNHPVPTFELERFVAELQGLTAAERLARYDAWELTPAPRAAIDEYLQSPTCGHLAEAELRRLGMDGPTDWSVGFVSVAAGIMLAAYFVRCVVGGVADAMDLYPERRLIFLGAHELMRSRAQRKSECAVCGHGGTG